MNKIKAVTPKITASKVDGDIYYSIHYYDAQSLGCRFHIV